MGSFSTYSGSNFALRTSISRTTGETLRMDFRKHQNFSGTHDCNARNQEKLETSCTKYPSGMDFYTQANRFWAVMNEVASLTLAPGSPGSPGRPGSPVPPLGPEAPGPPRSPGAP